MGSTLTTLEYIVREIANTPSGPWLSANAAQDGESFCVDLVSMWNCCSRCFMTRLRTMGEGVRCDCGQYTANQYRRVRVRTSAKALLAREGEQFRRVAQVIRGVVSAHPAEFEDELTVIDVGLWKDPPPKLETP